SKNVRVLGEGAEENKNTTPNPNYNAYANYDKTIGSDHHLNIVAGGEGTRRNANFTDLYASGLVGSYPEIGTPANLSGSSYLGDEMYLMGLFGRANYNYAGKYYAGLSARRDGISKFTPANRWANFLSGSLG